MAEELDFTDELVKAIKATPFVPFTLVMASGDRYEVTDPINIAFGGDLIFLIRPRQGSAHLRLYNLSSIEMHEPAH